MQQSIGKQIKNYNRQKLVNITELSYTSVSKHLSNYIQLGFTFMFNIAKITPKIRIYLPLESWFFPPRLIFFSFFTLTLFWVTILGQLSTLASTNYAEQAMSSQQMSYQENSITLNSEELKRPLYLKIETSTNTKITGEISLKTAHNYEESDRAIATLKNNLNIDLSPLLQPGKNTIEIMGSYEPKSAAVTVQLEGKNTQSTTSTQGTGIVQQKLIIHVL